MKWWENVFKVQSISHWFSVSDLNQLRCLGFPLDQLLF